MQTTVLPARPAPVAVRHWWDVLRGRDVALAYALVVVALTVALAVQPADVRDDLVLRCSTNLVNLRDRPLTVLVTSAFVVPSLTGLWVLPLLLVAYGGLQRWLGRLATVLVAVIGRVFATVFVAVLLAAGIAHHALDRTLAHEQDVGVSYGLVAVLAVLVARLPGGPRRALAVGGTLFLAGLVAVGRTPTDAGHAVAWLLGLAVGTVGAAVARAAVAQAARGAHPAGARTRERLPEDAV